MVHAPTSGQQFDKIRNGISIPRLNPYDSAADGNQSLSLDLYRYNLDLSAAFYELIGLVEVVLRNALNDRLSNTYGSNWFSNHELFDDRTLREFERCWRYSGLPNGVTGSTISNGKFISRLSFGTWTNLLDAGGYQGKEPTRFKCDYENLFWRPCLHSAFPNSIGTRKPIYLRASQIQMIRNRVAHHEPLLWGFVDRTSNRDRVSVTKAHSLILEFADLMDSDIGNWLRTDDKIHLLLKAVPKGVSGLLVE
ncbi:MAG: Abi family protein [Acidobacteriota bacterium]|nr:Abi family protein [Acidobacteriota bacterium]